jgi:hypothetical protein
MGLAKSRSQNRSHFLQAVFPWHSLTLTTPVGRTCTVIFSTSDSCTWGRSLTQYSLWLASLSLEFQ